jgi:hypothetical protein
MCDANLEGFIGTVKRRALPLAVLPPLAAAVPAALAWALARLLPAGENLTLVLLAAGIVSSLLGLTLALAFRGALLRSAGAELVRTIADCSTSSVSASEAKEIFVRMGEMLKVLDQADQGEKEGLKSAVAEISDLLGEADAVVGLAREKIARMIKIAASASAENSGNLELHKEADYCLPKASSA